MTPASLRLWLFVKNSTPTPLLLSKFIKTPAGFHSYNPAPVHHWYLPVAPDGVLTYRKSKFAWKCSIDKAMPSRCQAVSPTFLATECFFQIKRILKVFSTSAGDS